MAAPRGNAYPVASGAGVYAGRPRLLPAWLDGKPLNTWFAIPGTVAAGVGGLTQRALNAYNGWAFREDTNELFFAAIGGHDDGTVNSVISVSLDADAPSWVARASASPSAVQYEAYNPDGKPVSRHVYQHNFWSAGANRILLVGCRYAWGNGPPEFRTVDGWNPDTSSWDAGATKATEPVPASSISATYNNDGSFPLVPAPGYGHFMDHLGRIWTTNNYVLDPVAKTWTTPSLSGYNPPRGPRWPACMETASNRVFFLQWGDGQGFDSSILSYAMNPATGVRTQITFSSPASDAAVAAFTSQAPAYAAMDWDATNGYFLFFAGSGSVFRVTPNAGSVWDMSIHSVSGSPPAVGSGGLNRRFTYIPALKGFVCQPDGAAQLHFLRTA